MKPSELLATTPISVSNDLWQLDGHLPEVDFYCLPENCENDPRVEIKTHLSDCYDGIRGRWVDSVWFDSVPVLIHLQAGRDGRDEHRTLVVNKSAYIKLVSYLMTLYDLSSGVVPINEDCAELTTLYGQPLTLEDFGPKHYQEFRTKRGFK